MLYRAGDLMGFTVKALDGEVGIVHDLYFDDEYWTVRYAVVELYPLGQERLVLVSPVGLKSPRWGERVLPLTLTLAEVNECPDIDADPPVSRQYEERFAQYLSWPQMGAPEELPDNGSGLHRYRRDELMNKLGGDPHLRSCKEVIGYTVRGTDGELGQVSDLVLSDTKWIIRYILLGTRAWLPSKKVLVATEWVDEFDWAGSEVRIDMTTQAIQESPDYVTEGMLQHVPGRESAKGAMPREGDSRRGGVAA